jgi:hypothetical protein
MTAATAQRPAPSLALPAALVVGGLLFWLLRLSIGISIDRSGPLRRTAIVDGGSPG